MVRAINATRQGVHDQHSASSYERILIQVSASHVSIPLELRLAPTCLQ